MTAESFVLDPAGTLLELDAEHLTARVLNRPIGTMPRAHIGLAIVDRRSPTSLPGDAQLTIPNTAEPTRPIVLEDLDPDPACDAQTWLAARTVLASFTIAEAGIAACPHCHALLDPVPKRARACASCGGRFHVRTAPDDILRIVTPAGADAIDQLWTARETGILARGWVF